MNRKLVRQGTSTLMISLPAAWIKHFHLTKGCEVDVNWYGNDLSISAKGIKEKKEYHLKLESNLDSVIRTLISNPYREGYDIIHITFDSESQYALLQKTLSTRLIGFEIIKREKNHCIVENVTEPSGDQFDNILRKQFLTIREGIGLVRNRLEGKKDFNFDDAIEEIAARTHKYDNFCRRSLIKQQTKNHPEMLWAFLSHIQHGFREIYFLNSIIKDKADERVLMLCNDALKTISLIEEMYFERKVENMIELHKIERSLVHDKVVQLLTSNSQGAYVHFLLNSIRTFYLANSPIFGYLISAQQSFGPSGKWK